MINKFNLKKATMKNFHRIFLAIAMIVSIFTINSIAGDRIVLVERYTSSTCGPCAGANPTLDNLIHTTDPSKLTSISYHMSWPAPGNDPMYLYNTVDNNARRSYYGVNSIPFWMMDGTIQVAAGSVASQYAARTNVLSPVTIIVTHTVVGDSMIVNAKIFCEDLLPDPSVRVHMALLEKNLQYPSPPGTNGETLFLDVMRKMNGSGSGASITLFPGQTVELQQSFYIDPLFDETDLLPLVFVQAANKEILNAGVPTYDFTMLSDFAFKVVDQGQNASADYEISIPVVADGYNLPVNLTYEVQPPTAGITASFPNGSTISSFPGDALLRISSTSAVPSGVYKVIVTGTNSAGDEHKIIVSYLVGKNYVSVGSNRPQTLFSVDGNNYSSPRVFNWDINSPHVISVTSPQTFANTRYVFENWSNGSNDLTQNINVNSSTSNYTANFKTQFKFSVFTNPGGLPVTITSANEFIDSGATLNVSVSPTTLVHNGQTLYFQRWIGGGNGSYTGTNPTFEITSMDNYISEVVLYDTIVSVSQLGSEIPDKFELYQNFPNPFNPETKIKFDIPAAGNVKLTVYNMLGETVAVLQNGFLNYGRFESSWNASQFASGVYFYKLEAENFVSIKKLVLLK